MECVGCGSTAIASDSIAGEHYCMNCGLVLEEDIDYSVQWHGGLPTSERTSFTLVNKGLGSVMPMLMIFKQPNGFHLSQGPYDGIERSFAEAIPFLEVVWGVWGVPAYTKERSAMVYRKCIRAGITRGRDLHAMAIISTWLACEENGIHRSIEELAENMGIGNGLMEAYLRAVKRVVYRSVPMEKVSLYLRECMETLAVQGETEERAMELLAHVLESKLELGRHPAVVAGAILYIASNETGMRLSQSIIAKTLNVSERSIRRIYEEFSVRTV